MLDYDKYLVKMTEHMPDCIKDTALDYMIFWREWQDLLQVSGLQPALAIMKYLVSESPLNQYELACELVHLLPESEPGTHYRLVIALTGNDPSKHLFKQLDCCTLELHKT